MPKRASRIGCRGTWTSGPDRSSTSASQPRACGANVERQRAASAPSDASVAVKPRSMTPAVPSSSGCASASSGMRELEAVPLEREGCERRRTGRERMDGRAHVVPVARQGQRFGARAAADLLGGFEQQHRIPRSGEERGRGEPVGPRADDHRVVLGLGVLGAVTGASPREAGGALPPSLAHEAEK